MSMTSMKMRMYTTDWAPVSHVIFCFLRYRLSGFQRCSTPKDFVESKEEQDYDDEIDDSESTSCWPPTDDDDYQWSEWACDPYESYDWEC